VVAESLCIQTPKHEGQTAITILKKLGIFDKNFEIQRDEADLYIPILNRPTKEQSAILRSQIDNYTINSLCLSSRKISSISFAELLRDKLPPELLEELPRVDFVGDIAIVEMPSKLMNYKTLFGETILKSNRKVHTVLEKKGPIAGIYRLRDFAVIAGEHKTETVHKENGCLFNVNLANAYFSPRLSFEHQRVTSLVRDGETIIDMFSGVGSFAVQIAKNTQNVKVYAIDINPDAFEYLKRNIRLNRVNGTVHAILGDAEQIVEEKLPNTADRVIMNLPESAYNFIHSACKSIKSSGGIVHFYSFLRKPDSFEHLRTRLILAVQKSGRKVDEILFSRFVRETAPYEWQVVVDIRIS
jgi:tRNA (guanine37-N1)-methyltransferase